jgi:hypothetical protein
MARGWSITLLLLLALPIAAPATAPIPGEARWQEAPALLYRAHEGDTLPAVARRALGDPSRIIELAAVNGLSVDAPLRAGQDITIPAGMLRREMLTARVISFAGQVETGQGEPLRVGSELREGDIINIGANSHVTLDMGPAGRVTLPSQTRLRFTALHRVALTGAIERRLEPVEETSWLAGRRGLGMAGGGRG